jgi:hypothetical protein
VVRANLQLFVTLLEVLLRIEKRHAAYDPDCGCADSLITILQRSGKT